MNGVPAQAGKPVGACIGRCQRGRSSRPRQQLLVVGRLAQQPPGHLAQAVDLLVAQHEARRRVAEIALLVGVGDGVDVDFDGVELNRQRLPIAAAQVLQRTHKVAQQLHLLVAAAVDRHAGGADQHRDHVGRLLVLGRPLSSRAAK
jgi:hypothetical protein